MLSNQRLRDGVRRDLNWLFNTTNLASVQSLELYPEVERSVLNYGLPDLAGRTASSIDRDQLERQLRRAIWEYEPRLTRKSIQVKLAVNPTSSLTTP